MRLNEEDVARLVSAVRSILMVRGEVLQALEMALSSLREPLRSLLREEMEAWYGGRRSSLFGGVNGVDPQGYFRLFASIISSPGASREEILAALAQLEERISRKKR
ncbi:MAG: hypothetical protein ACP5NB_13000 [Chloroflexia bacterium]